MGHGPATIPPRAFVDGEEPRVVLAPGPADVRAGRAREVARGVLEADVALNAVDVDGVTLAEGLLAALPGEAQSPVWHCCMELGAVTGAD